MKKYYLSLLLVVIILAIPMVSVASDISTAKWYGLITVSNNNSAETDVATVFTLNTTAMADLGYLNTSGNNTAIRASSGGDIAYMPGYDGNVWGLFVPTIGANTYLTDTLYTGGTTNMSAKVCYFPGSSGMTIADDATIEPSDNFTIELEGYYDTSYPTANYTYLDKDSGIKIWNGASGNITAELINVVSEISYTTGYDGTQTTYDVNWNGQTFTTVGAFTAAKVGFYGYRVGDPGTVTVSIRATAASKPTGADLASGTLVGTTITTASPGEEYVVDMAVPVALSATTQYAIVIRCTGADVSNMVRLQNDESSPTYAGGAFNYSGDSGGSWTIDATKDLLFNVYSDSTVEVSASSIPSGHMNVEMIADGTDLELYIDSVLKDTVALAGATVTDTTNDWLTSYNGSMFYINKQKITVGGILRSHIEWEYGTTFTDLSGNGNDATPSFITASSDPHVSATLSSFLPIEEADAPDYTLTDPPDFITSTPGMSGNFTASTLNITAPGWPVVTAVAIAGGVPERLPATLMATMGLLMLSFALSFMFRTTANNNILLKATIVFAAMCVLAAVRLYDIWQLYFFVILALGVMWMSRQREVL